MNKEDVVKFDGYEATVEQVMEANKYCSDLGFDQCNGCPLNECDCNKILPGLSLEALKLAVKGGEQGMKMLGNARKPTEAEQKESTIHILNGLISYHERMTMGMYPARDFYLEALRYALKCVQEKEATNENP